MSRIEEIEARLQALDGALEEYDRTRSSARSVGAYLEVAGNARADLRYLLDFVKAAREALEFYAKPEHWAYNVAEELDDPLVHHDGGRIASEALAFLESP